MITWSNFVLGQELLFFDTLNTIKQPIFSHSTRETRTLHGSAPVVHPHSPLVVWPICTEKLLFVDMRNIDHLIKKKNGCFSL